MLEPPSSFEQPNCSHPLLAFELLTWPLPMETIVVRRLADHRRRYLEYSGPLDNDRGTVEKIASGILVWDTFEPSKLLEFGLQSVRGQDDSSPKTPLLEKEAHLKGVRELSQFRENETLCFRLRMIDPTNKLWSLSIRLLHKS